jgi:hypothetical protein
LEDLKDKNSQETNENGNLTFKKRKLN